MAQSIIYDLESEDRKNYLADKFKDSLDIPRSYKYSNFNKKIKELIDTSSYDLDQTQYNLKNYIQSESKKKTTTKDLFNRLKKLQEEEIKQVIKRENITFKPIKKGSYSKGDNKVLTEVKGKLKEIDIESYMSKGKIKYRFRDDKGIYRRYIP